MSLFATLSPTTRVIASEEQRLETGLINAMKLINGQSERAGDSGKAIQAYIKKGYLNKKPNRRVDYTDYWLLKKPVTFMGHTLIMIEEEYLLKYIGCCVNEGVGVTLKISGNANNLEHFASENGCSFSEEINIQDELKSLGIKSNFPKGNYVSLSCRERDRNLPTEPSSAMKAVYGIVITKDSSLNIRQSMGKDTKVVAKASKDSKLRILEALGTWYKVQLDDGTIGYASSEYIQVLSEKSETDMSNRNNDVLSEPESESLQCGGKRYCSQMTSCAEARFYLNTCGLKKLDRDGDGIPCENVCR